MRKNSGFTLLELMVTVALIAILAAIAIPNMISWMPDYRLKSAARDVYSNFQLAKLTAIRRNTNCTITFTPGTGYMVYVDSDNDFVHDTGEDVIANVLWSDYKGVSYDTSEGGGDGLTFLNNIIAFSPKGFPMDNSGNFGDGTVYLKNTNNKTTSVVVFTSGNIRIP